MIEGGREKLAKMDPENSPSSSNLELQVGPSTSRGGDEQCYFCSSRELLDTSGVTEKSQESLKILAEVLDQDMSLFCRQLTANQFKLCWKCNVKVRKVVESHAAVVKATNDFDRNIRSLEKVIVSDEFYVSATSNTESEGRPNALRQSLLKSHLERLHQEKSGPGTRRDIQRQVDVSSLSVLSEQPETECDPVVSVADSVASGRSGPRTRARGSVHDDPPVELIPSGFGPSTCPRFSEEMTCGGSNAGRRNEGSNIQTRSLSDEPGFSCRPTAGPSGVESVAPMSSAGRKVTVTYTPHSTVLINFPGEDENDEMINSDAKSQAGGDDDHEMITGRQGGNEDDMEAVDETEMECQICFKYNSNRLLMKRHKEKCEARMLANQSRPQGTPPEVGGNRRTKSTCPRTAEGTRKEKFCTQSKDGDEYCAGPSRTLAILRACRASTKFNLKNESGGETRGATNSASGVVTRSRLSSTGTNTMWKFSSDKAPKSTPSTKNSGLLSSAPLKTATPTRSVYSSSPVPAPSSKPSKVKAPFGSPAPKTTATSFSTRTGPRRKRQVDVQSFPVPFADLQPEADHGLNVAQQTTTKTREKYNSTVGASNEAAGPSTPTPLPCRRGLRPRQPIKSPEQDGVVAPAVTVPESTLSVDSNGKLKWLCGVCGKDGVGGRLYLDYHRFTHMNNDERAKIKNDLTFKGYRESRLKIPRDRFPSTRDRLGSRRFKCKVKFCIYTACNAKQLQNHCVKAHDVEEIGDASKHKTVKPRKKAPLPRARRPPRSSSK